MAYDRYDWHAGGDFPVDLPPEAGGTHIAMFLCWMILKGHAGAEHLEDNDKVIVPLQRREVTPRVWFFQWCDGKFWRSDLDDKGNKFTAYYYCDEGQPYKDYVDDYQATFPDYPDFYSVPDSWESFDQIAIKIHVRYASWLHSKQHI